MSLETKAKSDLVRVIDAYQAAQPVGNATLSKAIYGASWFVEKLRDGTCPSFGLRKFDEIITWFSENWPRGAKWPTGIPHGPLTRVPVHESRQRKEAKNGQGQGKKVSRKKISRKAA